MPLGTLRRAHPRFSFRSSMIYYKGFITLFSTNLSKNTVNRWHRSRHSALYTYEFSHCFANSLHVVRIKRLEALNAVGKKLARQTTIRDPRLRPSAPGESTTQLRRCGSLVPTESRMDGTRETQVDKSEGLKVEHFAIDRAKIITSLGS